MSRMISTLLVMILAVFAASGQQQQNGPERAKAFYESHRSELKEPLRHNFGGGRMAALDNSSAPVYPGDNAKYVVLGLNNTYPKIGDQLLATLVVINGISDSVSITGRLTTYHEDTQEQTAEFFVPRGACGSGYCQGGLTIGQNLELFSTQISEADTPGDHCLDFTIWNNATGKLSQQVFAYYYVGRTSNFGRFFYRLDKAEITAIQNGIAQITLSGRFPSEEMQFWAGNLACGCASFGPVKSADGKTLRISLGIDTNYEIPYDLVILFPGARVSWTLPNGVILPSTNTMQ